MYRGGTILFLVKGLVFPILVRVLKGVVRLIPVNVAKGVVPTVAIFKTGSVSLRLSTACKIGSVSLYCFPLLGG